MKKIFLILAIFSLGYTSNDLLKRINYSPVSPLHAEVDGMGHKELRKDRDFKKAVRMVVMSYCRPYNNGIQC